MNIISKFIAVLSLPVMLFAGPSCGDVVSGNVVLDADLNCVGTNGLVVGADNTTIQMNGHTVSCTGGGYMGSCQGLDKWGIYNAKKNVTVKGPGKIAGFEVGVWMENTAGSLVRDLEVTGPASPGFGLNPRVDSAGILVQNSKCPVDNATTVNIQGNKVSNHRLGIFALYSGCVNVGHNNVFDNNSDVWQNSWGILLGEVANSTITSNIVERNGDNLSLAEGGIGVGGPNSKGNVVTNNMSSNNCGDGIQLGVANPGDNVVTNNVAHSNGTSALGNKCKAPAADMYFDIAERFGATRNKVNKNNRCETQFGTMPAGICNPGEKK